jgi:hypothetical protein
MRNRLKPRVRDLFQDLMKDQGDAGAYIESQCLKVAELTARAEDLRAKLAVMVAEKGSDADQVKTEKVTPLDADQVKSLAALINSVTRLESTCRRAAGDLGKVTTAKPKLSLLQQQMIRDGKAVLKDGQFTLTGK